MSVDLRLLPINYTSLASWDPVEWNPTVYSHTILDLSTRRQLFTAIENAVEAGSFPTVPDGFHTFLAYGADGEHTYGETLDDPYGSRIRVVPASFFRQFSNHEGVTHSRENSAAWVYLAALHPDHPIALYWC